MFLGAVAAAIAVAVAVSAQVPVTVTLRSGEKVQGSLVDLRAAGLEMQVNGSERMIPKDQVAVVDFGGVTQRLNNAAMQGLQGLSSNKHLVVFRNGNTEILDWTDVGGTSPLILRFGEGNNEKEYSSNEVARIYLAVPPGSGPTTPSSGGAQPDGTVVVLANTQWNRTGITVRTGDYLRFQVSGEVRFGTGPDDTAGPDGSAAARGIVSRMLPVRTLPLGGLIGAVGNNPPFSIGSAPQPIRMPGNGELVLGVNDNNFNDNSGSFRVVITRGR